MTRTFSAVLLCACLAAGQGWAAQPDQSGVPSRTNGQNYKDRALAGCIATAYKGSPAGDDASASTGAYLDWTAFDAELEPLLDALIAKYLARNYMGSPEAYAGARFELLKCIDLYRSKDLEQLMRKAVPHPTWVGDKPAKAPKR
ncbi:T6SS amidase immunity protein Tai4 family protein [Niveibacterium sp. SC-1]|uniref:T6SS amidase immunity protein Tai4 family protein n=1 Tax=Niveibacterium sp. SC-1 TaxID=3135646 RepID=UPI00311FF007